MKTLCAWCGSVLHEGSPPVSHGICLTCRQLFFQPEGVSVQSFINTFSFPVIVVNSSFDPVAINRSAAQSSHLSIQLSPDTSVGNLLECKHSRLPEGCGKTVHCSGCVLRRTLEETYTTGHPAVLVPASINTNSEEVVLYISTVKTENRIFVKIDKAESS